MIVLIFIVFCVLLSGLGRLKPCRPTSSGAGTARPADTRPSSSANPAGVSWHPGRVGDRWTALDDRQLTRLLEDTGPC
jgi:hypothetical protein